MAFYVRVPHWVVQGVLGHMMGICGTIKTEAVLEVLSTNPKCDILDLDLNFDYHELRIYIQRCLWFRVLPFLVSHHLRLRPGLTCSRM